MNNNIASFDSAKASLRMSGVGDISYIWTRFNRQWAAVGVTAGILAGFIAIAVAGLLSGQVHREPTYPLKLIGAALLGSKALDIDSVAGIAAGMVIHFGLAVFFGLAFAQFIAEWSRKRVLVFLGVLGGMAVWLFWSAMFMPAFDEPLSHLLPKPVSIFLHVVFGLSFGFAVVALRPVLMRK